MAIPQIIANNPIVKLFRTEQSQETTGQAKAQPDAAGAGLPEDIVEISEAAQQRFESEQNRVTVDNAQQTASETREILQDSGASLTNGAFAE